jgi:O-antigen biosynthesis protein
MVSVTQYLKKAWTKYWTKKWSKHWQRAKQIWQTDGGFKLIYKIARKFKRKLTKEFGNVWDFLFGAIASKLIRQWKKKSAIANNQALLGFPSVQAGRELIFPLEFGEVDHPQISIIIYAHNSPEYTYNCLAEISSWIDRTSYGIEVILIEDGSSQSQKLYPLISGLWLLKNDQQQGFISAIQRASTKAKGKWILALRQDVLLSQTALERMISTFQKQQNSGILFPKLSFPQRELYSGGGIIWDDGSLTNYGEGDFTGEPEYNYLKSIDFGLPIVFLVASTTWQNLVYKSNSFSKLNNPDFAIADLCLTLKHEFKTEVIYDPKAEIVCQYGYTYSYPSQPEIFPTSIFLAKWGNILASQPQKPKNSKTNLFPNRDRPTILIIDTLVPAYDKESGALRLYQIMGILLDLGYNLIFLPDQGHLQEPYTSVLEDLGIEVLYFSYKQTDWRDRLIRRLAIIDLAWVCRPELCEKYLPIIQTRPEIKLIYDTIDLHFLRLKRAWEIDPNQDPSQSEEWEKMRHLEFSLAAKVDVTVVVTDVEKQILVNAQAKDVQVIPNIHQIYSHPIPSFSDRQNLLFIGGYYHKPNVDAVIWLCHEIMPIIWQSFPNLKLTLLGSNPPPEVLDLGSDRVTVPGYIPDVEEYFLNHRLFVAPLRYGAGMKGKIGQSLSYGLPTITTSIGAEGMGLSDGENVLIANSADEIAQSVINLYQNIDLWQKLSQSSFEVIRPYTSESVKARIKFMLEALTT